jgi:STAS domain
MMDRCGSRPSPGPGMLTIRPLQDRAGLTLAGDADITTLDALRAALAALPTGDIHLDLSGLRFIDLACTRELIALAERHPAARLIAHDPPASLLLITALAYPHASITITGRSRPPTPRDEQQSA